MSQLFHWHQQRRQRIRPQGAGAGYFARMADRAVDAISNAILQYQYLSVRVGVAYVILAHMQLDSSTKQ